MTQRESSSNFPPKLPEPPLTPEQTSLSLFQPIRSEDHVRALRDRTMRMREAVATNGHSWGTKRGAPELLQEGNYAAFPPEVVQFILSELPEQATIVDVGCGEARLLAELAGLPWQPEETNETDLETPTYLVDKRRERQKKIDSLVSPEVRGKIAAMYGIDAIEHMKRRWDESPGIEWLNKKWSSVECAFLRRDVYDNLRKIMVNLIPEFQGADLVVSTALAYHLNDPWLAVRNMSTLVKPGGMLAVTTLPRLVNENEDGALDDNEGNWVMSPEPWHTSEAHYYNNPGRLLPVIDLYGLLVAPGEIAASLGAHNRHTHSVHYSTAQTPDPKAELFGGRISIRKLGNQELRMGFLFLAQAHHPDYPHDDFTMREVLVLARDSEEIALLKSKGFASLDDAQAAIGSPFL